MSNWCTGMLITMLFLSLTAAPGEHPFLIVKKSDYPELRARAARFPWKEMKTQAIYDVAHYPYESFRPLGHRVWRICDLVSAGALAYILEPEKKSDHLEELVKNLGFWEEFYTELEKTGEKPQWLHFSPYGASFLNSVLALDIIHDDLPSGDLKRLESLLGKVADWYRHYNETYPIPIGGVPAMNLPCILGVWALYVGDSTIAEGHGQRYKEVLLDQFSEGGVFRGGCSYANNRFVNILDAKIHYLDILEHTGTGGFYGHPKLQGFYEWVLGYSGTPFFRPVVFGDSSPDHKLHRSASPLVRAFRFGDWAAGYASWRNGGKPFKGRLLHYVLMKEPLPEPLAPPSRVWPEGYAAFLEKDPHPESLMGALWCLKETRGHAHKETNAIYLSGYGEHLLVNAGYFNWGGTVLGYPFSYIHDSALSGNTVMIGDADHRGKNGGGISESLVGRGVDYARGSSGKAMGSGHHERGFCFVHPQDGKPGYFVVLDEVNAGKEDEFFTVSFHPFADNMNCVTKNREWTSTVRSMNRKKNHVHLNIFLAVDPDTAFIDSGVIAGPNFVGPFLRARYSAPTGSPRRIASILFPHDSIHGKAEFSRTKGRKPQECRIELGDGVVDYVWWDRGTKTRRIAEIKFKGKACLVRSIAGRTIFVFGTGITWLESSSPEWSLRFGAPVSIFVRDGIGKIASKGARMHVHAKGLTKLRLGDQSVGPSTIKRGKVDLFAPPGDVGFHFQTAD